MLFEREIVVGDNPGDVYEARVVKQNRSQNESFGVDIGRETFL